MSNPQGNTQPTSNTPRVLSNLPSHLQNAIFELAQRAGSQSSSASPQSTDQQAHNGDSSVVIDFTRPEVANFLSQMANEAPFASQMANQAPFAISGSSDPVSRHEHAHHSHHGHSHQYQQFLNPGQGQRIQDENQNVNQQHGHLPTDQQPDWRMILKWCEKAGPFAVLIFIKLMYDHRLGILLFAGLVGTFYYANRKLELEIYNSVMRDNRQGRSKMILLGIIIFLLVNILAIYYVFADQQLYRSLYGQLPVIEKMDFWTLAWIVVITDFVLKFASVILKALVAMIPRALLSHNKRGKYYMFMEQLVQFYRCVLPVRSWLQYLADDEHGGQWFAAILLLVYVLFKANLLYKKLKELREAFMKLRIDMVFGTKPSREELKESGESCPICQDDFRDPVKLTCKHIFCEDCVSIWFDRERTCPMCRAHITDNPTWRDGSTSAHFQWY